MLCLSFADLQFAWLLVSFVSWLPGAGEAPTTTEFCDRQRGPIPVEMALLLLSWWW